MPFHIPVTFCTDYSRHAEFHENWLRAQLSEVCECQGKGFTDPRMCLIGLERWNHKNKEFLNIYYLYQEMHIY